jgi:hypothetical protein
MTWGGHEEWRERWARAPAHTRRRVRLAVGLALGLLHRHRWSLLVIPWLGGTAVAWSGAALGVEPAVAWSGAAGVAGGLWLHRLLLAGPRLRRAYERNRTVTRPAAAAGRRLRRLTRSP